MTDIINGIHSYFASLTVNSDTRTELANLIATENQINEILQCGYLYHYKDAYDKALDLLALVEFPLRVLSVEFFKEAYEPEKELLLLAISNSSRMSTDTKISYLKSVEDLCTTRVLKLTVIDAYSNACYADKIPLVLHINHFLFDSDSYIANCAREEMELKD